jgi:hypothetical protein
MWNGRLGKKKGGGNMGDKNEKKEQKKKGYKVKTFVTEVKKEIETQFFY